MIRCFGSLFRRPFSSPFSSSGGNLKKDKSAKNAAIAMSNNDHPSVDGLAAAIYDTRPAMVPSVDGAICKPPLPIKEAAARADDSSNSAAARDQSEPQLISALPAAPDNGNEEGDDKGVSEEICTLKRASAPLDNGREFDGRHDMRSSQSAHPAANSNPSPAPLYLRPTALEATLVSGNIAKILHVPPHVDRQEWLASHLSDFFYLINIMYSTVSDVCTPANCPVMSVGPNFSPLCWTAPTDSSHDSFSNSHPMSLLSNHGQSLSNGAASTSSSSNSKCIQCAPSYIDAAMSWIQQVLDDPARFPVKSDAGFPADFESGTVRQAFLAIYNTLAHIYTQHFDRITALHQQGHLNTLFVHFVAFARTFELLHAAELSPLQPLVAELFRRHGLSVAYN